MERLVSTTMVVVLLGSCSPNLLNNRSFTKSLADDEASLAVETESLLKAQREWIKTCGHSLDRFELTLSLNASEENISSSEKDDGGVYFSTGLKPSDDCQLSWCAGYLIRGQDTCNQMGKGLRYSGDYTTSGCGVGTAKVKCCTFAGRKTDPGYIWKSTECEWSYCAGSTVPGQRTCNDYKKTYAGVYTSAGCRAFRAKVECCKIVKYLSKECKRTFTCHGSSLTPTRACQVDYGDDYQAVIEDGGDPNSCGGFQKTYKCCK